MSRSLVRHRRLGRLGGTFSPTHRDAHSPGHAFPAVYRPCVQWTPALTRFPAISGSEAARRDPPVNPAVSADPPVPPPSNTDHIREIRIS